MQPTNTEQQTKTPQKQLKATNTKQYQDHTINATNQTSKIQLAPKLASSIAMAFPIPCEPPHTRAIFVFRERSIMVILLLAFHYEVCQTLLQAPCQFDAHPYQLFRK